MESFEMFSNADELLKEATAVREEKNRLEEELLGLKAAAAVIESTKQEELAEMKRKCEEEVASLQRVMDGEFIKISICMLQEFRLFAHCIN